MPLTQLLRPRCPVRREALLRGAIAVWLSVVFVSSALPGRAAADDTFSAAYQARIAATGKRGFLYLVTRPKAPPPGALPGAAPTLAPTAAPTEAPTAAPTAAPPVASRLILYGTVHVGDAELFPLNRSVAGQLAGSERLALEADPRRQTEIAGLVKAMALYPLGDSLEEHVPRELFDRLPAMADRFHFPLERMERLRPWMLAQSLEVLELSRAGLSGSQGVEGVLVEFAAQRNIPVVEIEGFKQQFQLLSDAPAPVQEDELRQSIDDIEDGDAIVEARRLLLAWSTADGAAISSALFDMRQSEGAFASYLMERILDRRNLSMADRAEQFLAQPGATFFAVGSLHLFSDEGLIAELIRRGYSVTNLQ